MFAMHVSTSPSLRTAIALSALLGISACKPKAPPAAGGPPPADVAFLAVAPKDVVVDFEYVGQVAGSREVEVRPRDRHRPEASLRGRLPRRRGADAQESTRLRSRPAGPAEADLFQAQARSRQATRDLDASSRSPKRKVVSRKGSTTRSLAADLAQAAVKSAEARVTTARIDLSYTDVKAPLGGIAGRALKVEGSLANAQGDSLLTTIAQVDPIDVNFGVAEAEQRNRKAEIESGALVLPKGGFEVKLLSSEGKPLGRAGKVDFRTTKADLATGSFALRATFPNADGLLAPGQFVRVVLGGARRPSAIAVPQRAVLDAPTGKFVYVVGQSPNGPVAEPRPVEVGEWVRLEGGERNGWLIRKGIKAGDQVIVDGTARIFFPGAPVKPERSAPNRRPPLPRSKRAAPCSRASSSTVRSSPSSSPSS
jgi:membrane fusion protein (multidrug efflux system)